jgi:hypothetical protein
MRSVFFAGTVAALLFVAVNRALYLLNQPSDLAVAGGYFLLLAIVAVLAGIARRLWRRI